MKKTKKLIATSTRAVAIFAHVLRPDSFGLRGRAVSCVGEHRRFVAIFRAKFGNARDWVNVSLCTDPVREYGPTLPRAAARKRAYSKSKASKSERRPDIPDDRRRSGSFWCDDCWSLSKLWCCVCNQGSDSLQEITINTNFNRKCFSQLPLMCSRYAQSLCYRIQRWCRWRRCCTYLDTIDSICKFVCIFYRCLLVIFGLKISFHRS